MQGISFSFFKKKKFKELDIIKQLFLTKAASPKYLKKKFKIIITN